MISRSKLMDVLEQSRTEENTVKIDEYVNLINGLSDAELNVKLKEIGLTSAGKVKKFLSKDEERTQDKFTKLNDLVSFGRKGKTIHIHVVPADLRNMLNIAGLRRGELQLIDALEQLQEKMKTDKAFKDAKQVYAVSGLIARPISGIFQNLGFDVKSLKAEEAKKDIELGRFYEMFKDKKHIGRAVLSKEKLLSDEWTKQKDERKKILEERLNNNLTTNLQNEVNSDEELLKQNENIKSKDMQIENKEL